MDGGGFLDCLPGRCTAGSKYRVANATEPARSRAATTVARAPEPASSRAATTRRTARVGPDSAALWAAAMGVIEGCRMRLSNNTDGRTDGPYVFTLQRDDETWIKVTMHADGRKHLEYDDGKFVLHVNQPADGSLAEVSTHRLTDAKQAASDFPTLVSMVMLAIRWPTGKFNLGTPPAKPTLVRKVVRKVVQAVQPTDRVDALVARYHELSALQTAVLPERARYAKPPMSVRPPGASVEHNGTETTISFPHHLTVTCDTGSLYVTHKSVGENTDPTTWAEHQKYASWFATEIARCIGLGAWKAFDDCMRGLRGLMPIQNRFDEMFHATVAAHVFIRWAHGLYPSRRVTGRRGTARPTGSTRRGTASSGPSSGEHGRGTAATLPGTATGGAPVKRKKPAAAPVKRKKPAAAPLKRKKPAAAPTKRTKPA